MKTILLTRGTPGCGKSTWIKVNGLEPYSINYDRIRLLLNTPNLNINGKLEINQGVNKEAFNLIHMLIERKMKNGEFIVLDGTHSLAKDFSEIKKLAKQYLYKIVCVDFTDIPINIIKMRNSYRDPYKRVPDSVIDKYERRFADPQNKIPSGIITIKPSEIQKILFQPLDLSNYEKIHHIGDIHGCNTVLQEYFKNGLNPNEAYIFCGDYIDRGIENVAVLKFLMDIINKPNVFCIEGNHEKWLWNYANDNLSDTPERFKKITALEIKASDISKKELRGFYRKLIPCAYYTYYDKTIFICHGGISYLPVNPLFISNKQLIKGIGMYSEVEQCDKTFASLADKHNKDIYQIHGHRNVDNLPITIPNCNNRCFDLEGGIEFGGYLRVVTLSKNGFDTVELKNNVYKTEDESMKEQSLLNNLRSNNFVREKQFGNISSFNFTKEAFYKQHWDKMNVKARGLYLNNTTGDVVARSYDKFFNFEENDKTSKEYLVKKLRYPVTAYIKENGYLGIVSVVNGELFITTKSNPDAEYAQNFKRLFYEQVKDTEKVKDYILKNNCSLIFEVIDTKNDPHIIRYSEDCICLLDVVENSIQFKRLPYSELLKTSQELGLNVKSLYKEFNSFDELMNFIESVKDKPDFKVEDYEFHHIEGFVFSDVNNYQFKLKLYFYRKWKELRKIANMVLNTENYKINKEKYIDYDKEFFDFVDWLISNKEKILKYNNKDIISLREKFWEEKI